MKITRYVVLILVWGLLPLLAPSAGAIEVSITSPATGLEIASGETLPVTISTSLDVVEAFGVSVGNIHQYDLLNPTIQITFGPQVAGSEVPIIVFAQDIDGNIATTEIRVYVKNSVNFASYNIAPTDFT